MNILSYLTLTIFAAETMISPLPDQVPDVYGISTNAHPKVSFGNLHAKTPLLTEFDEKPATGSTPAASPAPAVALPPLAGTADKIRLRKNSYTIALLGDSMIDTLGPEMPQLRNTLAKSYPGVSFTLLNFGVGATNIDYGITRIGSSYTYLGKSVPSLASTHPDIVVIESFGYNPYPDTNGGLDRHWLALAKAVDTVKNVLPSAKIIIAATIAPNSTVFGDGAPGLSFSAKDKKDRTEVIRQYLDSTVKYAEGEHLALADAYHPSLSQNGDGQLIYINGGDHIHYSDAGRELFSQKIAEAISTNHLLE